MEEKSKNLRVSDCHTAGFTKKKVDVINPDLTVKTVEITECDVCRQPCKVVEMIIDSI